ncbi:Calcium-dependent secretion activator 2 [Mactra antiquata]
MSFSVVGNPTPRHDRPTSARPGSAKPTTSRNPITGEEIPLRVSSRASEAPSRQSRKPEGIPGLDLKYLKEVEDYVYKPIELADYPLDTGRTDVSWGTAASTGRSYRQTATPRQQSARSGRSSRPAGIPGLALGYDDVGPPQKTVSQKPTTPREKKPTVWDKPPVPDPENCPLPSERHKQLYKQYEDDIKTEYKNKGNKDFTEEEIQRVIEEVKEKHPALDVRSDDIIEKGWTKRQSQATKQYVKKMDAEELLEHNKKLKMVETVMIDQLSRAVISDPAQDVRAQMSAGRRPRGSNRALHDSKVKTATTATENLLSKRVRFGARVLTRNGHDAIRELTGFFFSVDNTLTIYEFRQFGKSAKALPFIIRGHFCHLQGPREGEPYSLIDICPGHNIHIATSGQHSLPETLKRLSVITFRVTDVDEDEKRQILLDGVPSRELDDVYTRLHIPNKPEYTEKMVLKSIQTNVQKKIRKRAIRTITGLGRYYRTTDQTGSGILYRFELEKGLFQFHIELPPDTLDALFEILDIEEKGEFDYSQYMWAVLGTMIETRKSVVRKAFRKIDAGKKGYLTISDVQKFFNTTYRTGRDPRDANEVGPLQAFLDAVLPNKKQDEISYVEFEEYYEGLSLSMEDDEDFYSVLRNTWNI